MEVTLPSKPTSAAAAHSPPLVTVVGLPDVHHHCPQRSFGGVQCAPRPPGSTPSVGAGPGTAYNKDMFDIKKAVYGFHNLFCKQQQTSFLVFKN